MTSSSRKTIVRAATIIMLGNIVSRLLGLGREQVIAALVGAKGMTDAFVAASTVPSIIYDFLIGGAISAALITVFSDYADDPNHSDDLSRITSTLLTLAAIALSIIIVVLIVLAPQLIAVLGIGFAPDVRDDAIGLVRLMLPATFFMAISGIFTALLYARQRFVLPAFVSAVYNVSIIVVALIFVGVFGLQSLVLGVITGAVMQVVLQWPALRGLRVRPSLDFSHPALRRALKLYLPVALGFIVTIAGIFIDRNLASRTGEGSLAIMRFATTIIQFPLGLISVALSSAILPTLSRQATEEGRRRKTDDGRPATGADDRPTTGDGRPEKAVSMLPVDNDDLGIPASTSVVRLPTSVNAYKSTLALGIKLAMLAMLPAMVGLVAVREPLVRLLFERGAFGAGDTERTALAFLAYAPQLPFVALDQLLIAAFYARKNTITPVVIGVVSVGVYVLAALILIGPWGMPGLAFANALQNSSHAVILLALIWRAIGGLRGYGIGATTFKVGAAATVMGLAVALLLSRLGNSMVGLGVAAIVGVAIYLALVVLLRVEEVALFGTMLRERIRPSAAIL